MKPRRPLFAVLLMLWCALVWWLSSRSNPELTLGVDLPFSDWIAHAIEYAAGGFLAYGAAPGRTPARRAGFALTFCILWGVSDEWHQSYVEGRDSSLGDVIADAVGAALGTLVHVAFVSRSARRAS